MKKLLTGVVALAMAVSAIAPVAAGAQTTTTTTTTSTAYTFSNDLTIGSTGPDVVALQSLLISGGYLVMPAGVAEGYFGTLTQAALAAYQAAKGISPAVGYFGPITRAEVNASAGVMTGTTTTTACPAGFTCTPTAPATGAVCPAGYTCMPAAGTTVGTTASGDQEGTLTITLAATPASNANIRTNTDVPVYGLQFTSQIAPVTVQTIDLQVSDLDLGSNSLENPSALINTIKVWDGSTVLETIPVTSTTFTKDQNQVYYVQLSGLNYLVPLGTTKTLTISFSTNSIDDSRALTLSGYGTASIRAVSGDNISDFYNISGSGYTLTQTFQKPGTSNITLAASGSPLRSQNYYIDPSVGAQSVPVLVFTLKSTTGDSQLQTVYASTTANATGTNPTTLYLYDGSTLLSSKSVPTGSGVQSVTFNNLTDLVPNDGNVHTFTVKEDFPSGGISGSYGSTTVTGVTVQQPSGSNQTVMTSVSGVNQYFYNNVAQFVIAGTPTATATSNQNGSTTQLQANFTFNVTAQGSNVTQPVNSDVVVGFATNTTNIYTATNVSVTTNPNNNIGQGASAQVTVTAQVPASAIPASGLYTFFIQSITWHAGSTTVVQNYGLDDFKTPVAVSAVK